MASKEKILNDKSKTFAKSDIDNILLSSKTKFIYFEKDKEEFKQMYSRFNNDFSLYLSKLPSTPAKKYVNELFNRNLIFLGLNQISKTEGFFSKVVSTDDTLTGIVLDIKDLEIDISTGETKNIDDCIYATYYSFLKAAVILNKSGIRNDKKLLEMLAQYLYLIIISTLDSKSNLNTPKQKLFVKIVCYYAFFRYFLKESYSLTLRRLENIFESNKDEFIEFKPKFKDIEGYTSIKDIPKMLIDTKVSILDPNMFIISLVKKFKQYGFYCILGPLDFFIAFVITCKYPFALFTDNSSLNGELQGKIEDAMIPYMKKVRFGISKM